MGSVPSGQSRESSSYTIDYNFSYRTGMIWRGRGDGATRLGEVLASRAAIYSHNWLRAAVAYMSFWSSVFLSKHHAASEIVAPTASSQVRAHWTANQCLPKAAQKAADFDAPAVS